MSVVQKVTSWATGVPVLKLVESKGPMDRAIAPTTSNLQTSSKSRKRRASSLEDEELNAMLRDGKSVKRNPRQENELIQLQEGKINYHDCMFFQLKVKKKECMSKIA